MRLPRMTTRRWMIANVLIAVLLLASIRIEKMFRFAHSAFMVRQLAGSAKDLREEAEAYLWQADQNPERALVLREKAAVTTRRAEDLATISRKIEQDLRSRGWYDFP